MPKQKPRQGLRAIDIPLKSSGYGSQKSGTGSHNGVSTVLDDQLEAAGLEAGQAQPMRFWLLASYF
jgi:hypothetical protein